MSEQASEEEYVTILGCFTEGEQMNIHTQALAIAREHINLADADEWDTLGWVFADRAKSLSKEQGPDAAIGGVALAASMFKHAQRLRDPGNAN